MSTQELIAQIKKKKSFLCIGLDVDLEKIPQHLLAKEDPIFEFNKAIIDATHHLAVAYKPNIAFYEAYGINVDRFHIAFQVHCSKFRFAVIKVRKD